VFIDVIKYTKNHIDSILSRLGGMLMPGKLVVFYIAFGSFALFAVCIMLSLWHAHH
jgi:hypothetical protein